MDDTTLRDYIPLQSNPWRTSEIAYEELLKKLTKDRLKVAKVLTLYSEMEGWNGLVDAEIDDICTQTYGKRAERAYSKRRGDLYHMGLVAWTGDKRAPKTRHGNVMNVWRVLKPEELADELRRTRSESLDVLLARGIESLKNRGVPTKQEVVDVLCRLYDRPSYATEYDHLQAVANQILRLFAEKRKAK